MVRTGTSSRSLRIARCTRPRVWSLLFVSFLVLAASGPVIRAEFSDAAVESAIHRGVAYLWTQRQGDGRWAEPGGGHMGRFPGGVTALAAYALLESGVSPQEPRMAQTLAWLQKNKSNMTYCLGLRCNVWLAAGRTTQGKYDHLLEEEARQLWTTSDKGAYGYVADHNKQTEDNSNGQYAVLGVWAAGEGYVEVPAQYWAETLQYWARNQNRDGGWGYHPTDRAGGQSHATSPTMTAAGTASLFVGYDYIYADRFVDCQGGPEYAPIRKGLEWFDRNFAATAQGAPNFYYLYGVERVGLASGYKYFTSADWYQLGADQLLRSQDGDGGWAVSWESRSVSTAYALLFLIRGRHPVAFNKLEYNGDWKNRPRDLASLTRWMSRTFENTIHWQIVNLRTPPGQWHDAPILYITGSKAPRFSPEDLDKLKTYVNQGGVLFSVTQCNGLDFSRSIRQTYLNLFPQYQLLPVDPPHRIYTKQTHFDLPADVKFQIMSNGVRPLIIHTDADLALSWQLRRMASDRWAFAAAANVLKYVTDTVTALRPRASAAWPEAPQFQPERTIKLVRIRHGGNGDPEPLAYERLARLMGKTTRTRLEVAGPAEVRTLSSCGAKVAALTGTEALPFFSSEEAELKAFVDKGGTLIIDAAGGSPAFAASAEAMLDRLYGPRCLKLLSLGSPVYKLPGLEISRVKYRRKTAERVDEPDLPRIRAVMIGDRPAVLFSREDLTAGLVGYLSGMIDGYDCESAFQLMRNMIIFGGR